MDMIQIKVYAPAFCNFEHVSEDGYLRLPKSGEVNDALEKLCIPESFQKIMNISVNHEKADLATKLTDGDVVSFHSALWGG